MPEKRVLKGIFKEGTLVASIVIVDEKAATIYCKGAEPTMPMDTGFIALLKRVTDATREHTAKCEDRSLVTVFEQRPSLMDQMMVSPSEVEAMGVRFVAAMDADSGFILARYLSEPLATPLAYTSLKASPFGTLQPGRCDLPATFKRYAYRELQQPGKDVVGVAVQLAGDGLLRLQMFEDGGLRIMATLRDFPPARAKAALYDMGPLMDLAKAGKPPVDIANAMASFRAG